MLVLRQATFLEKDIEAAENCDCANFGFCCQSPGQCCDYGYCCQAD